MFQRRVKNSEILKWETFNQQAFFRAAGAEGCYYFCMVKAAMAQGVTLEQIQRRTFEALCEELMYFNTFDANDAMNLYVSDGAKLLSKLTGKNYSCEKVTKLDGLDLCGFDVVIAHYERNTTQKRLHHFVLPNWDSAGHSTTIRQGKLVDYRYFKYLGEL